MDIHGWELAHDGAPPPWRRPGAAARVRQRLLASLAESRRLARANLRLARRLRALGQHGWAARFLAEARWHRRNRDLWLRQLEGLTGQP